MRRRSARKNSLGQLARSILVCVTATFVALLWASALSTHLRPAGHPVLPLLGLMFPIFLACVLLALAAWLFIDRRMALLPLAGLLLCATDVRRYCPVNLPSQPPRNAIKVLSYNTCGFGGEEAASLSANPIIEYMSQSNADIICYQEGAMLYDSWTKRSAELIKKYPYRRRDFVKPTDNCLGLLSRFPIVWAQMIDYPHSFNGSMAYMLRLPAGDSLLVVNNHFQSNNLSRDDRRNYRELIKEPQKADIKGTSLSLATKIGHAGMLRSVQADSVVAFIGRHNAQPVIVVGDFNDTPISYTHRRLALSMTDAYVSTGCGVGFSYNRSGFFVRIDNMLCSPDLKPFACHVDRSIAASDHYPIYAWFAPR